MKATATWQGMAELERELATLSKGMQGQALRGAMRAAAAPVVKGAKANSPSRSVKKALTSIVAVTRNSAITARIGAKRGSPGGRILHLVEKGTRPHIITARDGGILAIPHKITLRRRFAQYDAGTVFGREVKHPGSKPRPFFQQALPENRPEAERKFTSALRQIVDKMRLRMLQKRGGQ